MWTPRINRRVWVMPKAFNDCAKNGGKIRTKKLKNGKYIRICYDKEGNSYPGEIKKVKENSEEQGKIKDAKILAEKLLDLKKHFDDNYRS